MGCQGAYLTMPPSEQVEKAPLESYADVGGLESQVQEIKEAVELPLTHPELYEDIGIKPPKVHLPWLWLPSPLCRCRQGKGFIGRAQKEDSRMCVCVIIERSREASKQSKTGLLKRSNMGAAFSFILSKNQASARVRCCSCTSFTSIVVKLLLFVFTIVRCRI